MRELEHLADGRTRGRQPERSAGALRARVTAHERADAGAVDRRDARQIHDQILVTGANELPQLALERFGRASGQKRLTRREQETIADGLSLTGNGHALYRSPREDGTPESANATLAHQWHAAVPLSRIAARRDEVPLIAVGEQRQLQHADRVVDPHFAVRLRDEEVVEGQHAARADDELADAAGRIVAAVGSLRRETFVRDDRARSARDRRWRRTGG